MENIYSIAKRGIMYAEPHGISSEFYPQMFVESRHDWVARLNGLRMMSDDMFDMYYSDAHNGDNVGPIGEINISKHDGFVYVYITDSRGNLDSRFFTHEVIAGPYTTVPPYGGMPLELVTVGG